jgi:Ca-activated chloride channel family protein
LKELTAVMRLSLSALILLAAGTLFGIQRVNAQDPVAKFQSNVDLVRVSAVVRDRSGRLVDALSAADFEIIDAGQRRPIAEFRRDSGGVSVALLFDVSGSMQSQLINARETANHVLSWLNPAEDEASLFVFDTQLRHIAPFTQNMKSLPPAMAAIVPFGETSLNDAIAETAREIGEQEGRRRAIVALTDGDDNASRLSPLEATQIASAIDVPVYLITLLRAVDRTAEPDGAGAPGPRPVGGALNELASATGGRLFVATSPAERSVAARHIVEELRHEYLLAFESSGRPGWHPLVVRARNKDLVVRARRGYFAGQSRPNSE